MKAILYGSGNRSQIIDGYFGAAESLVCPYWAAEGIVNGYLYRDMNMCNSRGTSGKRHLGGICCKRVDASKLLQQSSWMAKERMDTGHRQCPSLPPLLTLYHAIPVEVSQRIHRVLKQSFRSHVLSSSHMQ
jgi:hypothetical protein